MSNQDPDFISKMTTWELKAVFLAERMGASQSKKSKRFWPKWFDCQ